MASLVLNVAELLVVTNLLPPRHSDLLQELPSPRLLETTSLCDASKPWFLGYGTTLGLYTEGPTVTPLEPLPWLIVGLPALEPPPVHRCCLGETESNEPKFYDIFTFPLTTEESTRWNSQVFWNVPKSATGDLLVLDSLSDDNPHTGGNRFSFTTSRLRTGDVMVEHLFGRPSCEVVLARLAHLWQNRMQCHATRWDSNPVVLWKDVSDREAFVCWLSTHATLCSGKCRWWLPGN
ncbi:hypothetical protein IWQ62_003456 [Dispira parvispora]|uniref:Uncharacterized protein n=1 Tax=Dispira parvispora TaxID=1520584 RepID=A0A9W8APC4_9FUNG|nr:hypothetical protein IWQ62_003456 [Dispira parvispora]